MPIISKTIIENTKLASGYRIKLKYIFNDGYEYTVNCRGIASTSAGLFLANKESYALESKRQNDLSKRIEMDSDLPTDDTTQVEMYKAWMFKGYRSKDPIKSYLYLVKVAQKVNSLGLTVQQLANAFNEDIKTINLVLAKWQYLKSNKATLLAYKTIKEYI